jgi:hypothetical protein
MDSSKDLPHATTAALMLSVFTVSVGLGVVVPLLPYLFERLLAQTMVHDALREDAEKDRMG